MDKRLETTRKYYTRHLQQKLFVKMRVYAARQNISIEEALNQLLEVAFVNPIVKKIVNTRG